MTLTNVRKTRHWCLIMLPQRSSEIHCFQHYYKVPYKGNNLFGVLHKCGLCLNRFHCCVHHHLYWFDFVIMFSCVLFIFLIWSLYLSSVLFSSFLSGIVNVNVSHTMSVTNLPLCCIYCCVDLINLHHLHLRAHLQAAYTISETLDCHELPPILPLPPTLLWSLSFSIPLSHPHPAILPALLLWIGVAVGLSVSCFIEVGRSPVPASNLRDPDFASACGPSGSTMAPSLSVHQLHRAPSSLRLCLGQSLTIHGLGTPFLWLRLIPPSLLLH